jgi:hypothetical protein
MHGHQDKLAESADLEGPLHSWRHLDGGLAMEQTLSSDSVASRSVRDEPGHSVRSHTLRIPLIVPVNTIVLQLNCMSVPVCPRNCYKLWPLHSEIGKLNL